MIPEELLEQFERGNVLLFIGDGVTRDPEGVVVVEQIAYDLAASRGLGAERGWGGDQFPRSGPGVPGCDGAASAASSLCANRMEALGDEPQQVHLLIAGLMPCKEFASTLLDRRLERAFEALGRPLDVIVADADVPFEDERNAQLYKLRGSLDRPESLVLTEDDYDEFSDDQASISLVLQALLARKTIVFAGYDLADANFRRLHRKVTADLDGFGRRSYAFTMTATATVTRWCQRRGIELIRINPALFLQQLSEQLASRSRSPEPPGQVATQPVPTQAAVPLPDRPYKLLDYYRTEDAAIFFGRDQETRTLSFADPRAPAGRLVRGIGDRQDVAHPGGRGAAAAERGPAIRHAAHPGAGRGEPVPHDPGHACRAAGEGRHARARLRPAGRRAGQRR